MAVPRDALHGGFVMDELPPDQGEDEEASFVLEEVEDTAGLTPKFHDRQIAASLQRRLQAMGDTAERELSKAYQRQSSPNNRTLSPTGREIWGEPPLPPLEAPAVSGDPLADAARKLKWSGSQARPQNFRQHSPRSRRGRRLPAGGRRVIAGKAATSQCLGNDQRGNEKPSKWRLPPSSHTLCKSRETFPQAVRPATVPTFDSSRTNDCLEGIFIESQACSSSSSFAEWDGASTSVNSLLPTISRARAWASRPPVEGFCEDRSDQTNAQVSLGAAGSALCGSSDDELSALDMSDPVAVLLMYRRMLFQETNNGLMGGTGFISNAGRSAALGTAMQNTTGTFLRQAGSQRGLSRGGLRPLMSRS